MAYTIYIQFKNGTQSMVSGVVSEALEDVDYFDGSTYRDGPYYVDGVMQSFPNRTETTVDTDISGAGTLDAGNLVQTEATTSTMTNVTIGASPVNFLSDDAIKLPPRAHPRKRSRYKWTTSDGMLWAWADLIVGVSSSPHTYI